MGPVNARHLQDVRMKYSEQNREERPRRFWTTRAPTGQHVKMSKQKRVPPAHMKERAFPKILSQERELKFRINETIPRIGGKNIEATSVRITCSMVRYLKRYKRIQGSFATHADVGWSVEIGTIQLQQIAQIKNRYPRRSPSDSGNV